jgi:hydrogenase expression/formation protein HypC
MTAEEAEQTGRALDALDAVVGGEDNLDRFFADLTDRAPELPAHLRGNKP